MAAYDVLILGAGQAGIPLARQLADCGRSVALVERRHLGGSCVNFGCTPTKAVLAAARVARLARRGADFGLKIPTVEVDLPAVLRRARRIVADSRDSLRRGLDQHGVHLIEGHGRFAGRDADGLTLDVAGTPVRARQVVIDVGTRTAIPKIAGIDQVDYLHAGNWLDTDTRPSRLVVVGASYIGLEMAQFYRTAGAEVCVVGSASQILPKEDPDVAEMLLKQLKAEGVTFRLGAHATAVKRGAAGTLTVTLDHGGALSASHLFLAAGRRPNTDDLGLDTIGLKSEDDGTLAVDARLASAVPGVWVAGDVRGGPMFTHASWDDHRVLESQLLADGSRTTAGRIVPYAVFTDPELARVGLTETEARRQFGDAVKVATFAVSHNGRFVQEADMVGSIKVIADTRTGRLLGAAVLSSEAGELIGPYLTLMNADAPVSVIANGIFIHPTRLEAVQSAVLELKMGHADACP